MKRKKRNEGRVNKRKFTLFLLFKTSKPSYMLCINNDNTMCSNRRRNFSVALRYCNRVKISNYTKTIMVTNLSRSNVYMTSIQHSAPKELYLYITCIDFFSPFWCPKYRSYFSIYGITLTLGLGQRNYLYMILYKTFTLYPFL